MIVNDIEMSPSQLLARQWKFLRKLNATLGSISFHFRENRSSSWKEGDHQQFRSLTELISHGIINMEEFVVIFITQPYPTEMGF